MQEHDLFSDTMRSTTASASQAGLMLTPDNLRQVNSLTRASPKPGFLDCELADSALRVEVVNMISKTLPTYNY